MFPSSFQNVVYGVHHHGICRSVVGTRHRTLLRLSSTHLPLCPAARVVVKKIMIRSPEKASKWRARVVAVHPICVEKNHAHPPQFPLTTPYQKQHPLQPIEHMPVLSVRAWCCERGTGPQAQGTRHWALRTGREPGTGRIPLGHRVQGTGHPASMFIQTHKATFAV